MKNIELIKTINSLKEASVEKDQPIWMALAEELDKSKRRRVVVNLSRIDRHAEEGEVVAIPGKVLASGVLKKPIKIAAFSFSKGAKEKIQLVKGESMSIMELLDSGIKPSQIHIMK
jgi:large subunit ribosomal protein L18e